MEFPPRIEGALAIWTVYDHPIDCPTHFIARLWLSDGDGVVPTDEVKVDERIEPLREFFRKGGFVRLERMPDDDSRIMETWI